MKTIKSLLRAASYRHLTEFTNMMLVVKLKRTMVKPRSQDCITGSFGSDRSERSVLHRSVMTPVSSSSSASGSRYPIHLAGHGPLFGPGVSRSFTLKKGQTHSWCIGFRHGIMKRDRASPRKIFVLGYLGFRWV